MRHNLCNRWKNPLGNDAEYAPASNMMNYTLRGQIGRQINNAVDEMYYHWRWSWVEARSQLSLPWQPICLILTHQHSLASFSSWDYPSSILPLPLLLLLPGLSTDLQGESHQTCGSTPTVPPALLPATNVNSQLDTADPWRVHCFTITKFLKLDVVSSPHYLLGHFLY